MEDPKALKLFQEVLTKTKAGRIKWEPTANEAQYSSILPSGHALLVSMSHRETTWGDPLPDVFVLMLRSRGLDQELLRVTSDVDGVGQEGLNELYEFARRRALQVDATVDQVLGDLAKL
jgi:hypothetical protein